MTVSLRAARPTDAGTTGDILGRFIAETDWMPKLYSAAETVSFCGGMIDRGWMTVVERDERVLGFLARDGQEICALYIAPEVLGQGLGRMLLDDCKRQVGQLNLRAFAANQRARHFYRSAGFRQTGQSDGRGNEENLPDIAYVWTKEAAT